MKISVNAIRFFNDHYNCAPEVAPDGVDALVVRIGAQLAAVEETIDIGSKYAGVVIVRVVSARKHENSDHLNICAIDDGGITPDVKRDESGHVQVVCGAPNVREGLTVAWLPPGSTVPSSIDAGDPFVLSAREIRGEVSNGMLASPKELTLGDSHDGILEIDGDIAPGTLFAEQYNLSGDVVIDMENKMFTHRPDLFGTLGVARELAGIQGQKFVSPDWYRTDVTIAAPEQATLRVEIRNEIPELVPRFVVVPMSNIVVKQSPVWLQVELSRLGVRPINNVVDLTNYYMLLTGQPLHAYDYDKVVAQDAGADHATIVVRKPHDGETLQLLNGKTITPRNEAIMIASASKAIGLGGVMGGGDTEVDENTRNIILECASFDMYSIRRTAMAHGIFTDAVTRFNKGQSPLQNMAVLAKIVSDIIDIVGGTVAGSVFDDNHAPEEVRARGTLRGPETVSVQFVNDRLGLDLTGAEMVELLSNVEFHIHDMEGIDKICYDAPFWRTDIEIPEDIVEEIGRLYGFDKLPHALPERDLTPSHKNPMLELKARLRETLSRSGANELLTYSFVNGSLLDKVGQDKALAYKLSNALSPELQYYRLSLTPSLLDKVHANIKSGYDEFGLFEMGKAHKLGEMDDAEPTVPAEGATLGFVYSAKTVRAGAAYYQAQRYLRVVLDALPVNLQLALKSFSEVNMADNAWLQQITAPYDAERSALLCDDHARVWGVVGEFRATVRKNFKLPVYTAGFEIDPNLLLEADAISSYTVQPRFPKVMQDICLRVPASVTYQKLFNFAKQTLDASKPANSLMSFSPVDIYVRPDDTDFKQLTFRYGIASHDRTLTDAEISAQLDSLVKAAAAEFNAERV